MKGADADDATSGSSDTLRRAFDEAFADARGVADADVEDFLAIEVGGAPYAVRVSEVAGLYRNRTISPLTSRTPHLLGMIGVRGALVPVFDLGALLGHPDRQAPRWLVLARGGAAVGLAFDNLETHLRLPARDVSRPGEGASVRLHIGGVVRTGGTVRPIVRIESVLGAIGWNTPRLQLQRST